MSTPITSVPARPGTQASPNPVEPTFSQRLRRNRIPLLLVGLIVVLAALLGLAASGTRTGPLDPESADPGGARALAALLRDQGVTVRRTDRVEDTVRAAGRDTTLVVVRPSLISATMLARLTSARSAHVVLVAPDDALLASFAPGVTRTSAGTPTDDALDPGCSFDVAVRAGSATVGDDATFAAGQAKATACYPRGGSPTVLAIHADANRSIVAVGSARPFTNDALAQAGNASLALGLVGTSRTVIWWVPSAGDPFASGVGEESRPLAELLPAWVMWVALQLGVALVVTALWRSRRLGPVVEEPLPVVVRASEAVEGRGRLYQQSDARNHVAEALRTAARERLALNLGVARAPSSTGSLISAVSRRTGRAESEVAALLLGPVVLRDDQELLAFSRALDDMVTETVGTRGPQVTGPPPRWTGRPDPSPYSGRHRAPQPPGPDGPPEEIRLP